MVYSTSGRRACSSRAVTLSGSLKVTTGVRKTSSRLVQFFENEAVQLAHCRTVFTDDSGREEIWSINEYLHDLDKERWNHTIIETGHRIVADAFAIKNIIPNVSSAIFRNPRQLEILQDPEWKRMRTWLPM